MNLATLSILTIVGALMMTGFVHNPKFLVVGLLLAVLNQGITFYWGYSKGKKPNPKAS